MLAALLAAIGLILGAGPGAPPPTPPEPPAPSVEYRDSTALGRHDAGRLVDGVLLPPEGLGFFTWDPARRASPNRAERRWATDDTISTTLRIVRAYRLAHPGAARLGIGDLSRPEGGSFGDEVSPGYPHVSHQNGLDVDVYYPLRGGGERAPRSVREVDLTLAQDLVDRFVGAGATLVFVGPSLPLTGPPGLVQPLEDHDDHLHARFVP